VHLQPVDPGEVFQDAAGEGDDQVDVDVGVVFNASVTKGEQTLVYASSCSTLYARNGCMWIAWLFGHCLLFDASVLQAEQSSMSTCFLVQQQLHAYSLASDAIQITHWLSLRLSFPMLPEHCAPSQPVLHAAIPASAAACIMAVLVSEVQTGFVWVCMQCSQLVSMIVWLKPLCSYAGLAQL